MVKIAHARPEEREEIARFMQDVFPKAKWSLDGWRRLLEGRWARPEDSFAVTARDDGKLVGVLGLVTARRPTASGRPALTANMSSWYLLKPYRAGGIGGRMIEQAAADPQVTVTNFASAPRAVGAVQRAGLSVLDTHRLVWRPRPRRNPLTVHRDPLALGDALTESDRRVLTDHAGLNLATAAVETPDGLCVLAISAKRKHDDYVTHDVFHIGDRAIFARHARAIADSLLPPRDAILSVDSRFMPVDADPDEATEIEVPRFYTAGRMPAEDVDFMYSEIALLDIKIF